MKTPPAQPERPDDGHERVEWNGEKYVIEYRIGSWWISSRGDIIGIRINQSEKTLSKMPFMVIEWERLKEPHWIADVMQQPDMTDERLGQFLRAYRAALYRVGIEKLPDVRLYRM